MADEKQVVISRQSLLDGTFAFEARRHLALKGVEMHVRSDEDLETTLRDFIAGFRDRTETWVFGYGSLMWNPAFHFIERRPATLLGWHRSFCILDRAARGSMDRPGLMLALEEGGETQGIAFRLPPGQEDLELSLVWKREMFSNSYVPTLATIDLGDRSAEAVTFAVNTHQDRYAGRLSESEAAALIAVAEGGLGTAAEYLEQSLAAIAELGLQDAGLARIGRLVRGFRLAESGAPGGAP